MNTMGLIDSIKRRLSIGREMSRRMDDRELQLRMLQTYNNAEHRTPKWVQESEANNQPFQGDIDNEDTIQKSKKLWYIFVCVLLSIGCVILIGSIVKMRTHVVREIPLRDSTANLSAPLGTEYRQLHKFRTSFIATSVTNGIMTVMANGSLPFHLDVEKELGRIEMYTMVGFHFMCKESVCYEVKSDPNKNSSVITVTSSVTVPLNGTFLLAPQCDESNLICTLLLKHDNRSYSLVALDIKGAKIFDRASFDLPDVFSDNAQIKAIAHTNQRGKLAIYDDGFLHICSTEVYAKKRVIVDNCYMKMIPASNNIEVDIDVTREDLTIMVQKEPTESRWTRVTLYIIGGAEGIQMKSQWNVDVSPSCISILGDVLETDFKVCHLYTQHLVCQEPIHD